MSNLLSAGSHHSPSLLAFPLIATRAYRRSLWSVSEQGEAVTRFRSLQDFPSHPLRANATQRCAGTPGERDLLTLLLDAVQNTSSAKRQSTRPEPAQRGRTPPAWIWNPLGSWRVNPLQEITLIKQPQELNGFVQQKFCAPQTFSPRKGKLHEETNSIKICIAQLQRLALICPPDASYLFATLCMYLKVHALLKLYYSTTTRWCCRVQPDRAKCPHLIWKRSISSTE